VGAFGERLKRERDQRNVSLEDVSLSTKISIRNLKALEEEKFQQLPGGVFNRGFVRAYARHLGLDEEEMVALYQNATGDVPKQVESAREPGRVEIYEGGSSFPWAAVRFGLFILALGLAMWLYRSQRADRSGPAPVLPSSASSSAAVPAPAATGGAASSAANTMAASPEARGESAALPAAPAVRAATSSESAAPKQDATTTAAGNLVLKIAAREECWISIAADGQAPVEYTLYGADEKTVAAQKEITLRVGNAGAVDLFFDGKKMPPQGDFGEVKNLVFDVNGPRPASTAQAPAPSTPQSQ
jgi:cytoskeletal protein RodZ